MRTIQQSYAKPLVKEAIIRSVMEWAADLVFFLGTYTNVEKIISKLEMAYGTVSGCDVLMQQFYGLHMEKKWKSIKLCHQNGRVIKSNQNGIPWDD